VRTCVSVEVPEVPGGGVGVCRRVAAMIVSPDRVRVERQQKAREGDKNTSSGFLLSFKQRSIKQTTQYKKRKRT